MRLTPHDLNIIEASVEQLGYDLDLYPEEANDLEDLVRRFLESRIR